MRKDELKVFKEKKRALNNVRFLFAISVLLRFGLCDRIKPKAIHGRNTDENMG